MIRWGTCYRHDSNSTSPEIFPYEVGDSSQGFESWREGTVLIHNPHARHPVPRGWLGASIEQYLEDGRIVSTIAEPFHPYGSTTAIYPGDTPISFIQAQTDGFIRRIMEQYPELRPNLPN
jgi:hypothetical protein